jgi:nucleoside-diphosphate-sugar epimerase
MLPVSPYGQHKLMMEQLCQSYAITYNLRITVTRLFSVYGPNLRKQLLCDPLWIQCFHPVNSQFHSTTKFKATPAT